MRREARSNIVLLHPADRTVSCGTSCEKKKGPCRCGPLNFTGDPLLMNSEIGSYRRRRKGPCDIEQKIANCKTNKKAVFCPSLAQRFGCFAAHFLRR